LPARIIILPEGIWQRFFGEADGNRLSGGPIRDREQRMTKGLTTTEDLADLTLLGGEQQGTPGRHLETFPNHHPGRDYLVTLRTQEFTCVCPLTGQPDFAAVTVAYIPDQRILESKSFKLYLQSFRNEGTFHEHVCNVMLDDIVGVLAPRWCKISADFAVRGGVAISVQAEFKK
jgi:7-cyano-7-deazaguanine reductase